MSFFGSFVPSSLYKKGFSHPLLFTSVMFQSLRGAAFPGWVASTSLSLLRDPIEDCPMGITRGFMKGVVDLRKLWIFPVYTPYRCWDCVEDSYVSRACWFRLPLGEGLSCIFWLGFYKEGSAGVILYCPFGPTL